jgi:hypothetical protein
VPVNKFVYVGAVEASGGASPVVGSRPIAGAGCFARPLQFNRRFLPVFHAVASILAVEQLTMTVPALLLCPSRRRANMLNSRHNKRFAWSRQQWMAEPTYFRALQQNWRPTSRVLADADETAARSRSQTVRAVRNMPKPKPAWTPWLWVGT